MNVEKISNKDISDQNIRMIFLYDFQFGKSTVKD